VTIITQELEVPEDAIPILIIWLDFLWILELARNQATRSQRIMNSRDMNTTAKTLGNFRQKRVSAYNAHDERSFIVIPGAPVNDYRR